MTVVNNDKEKFERNANGVTWDEVINKPSKFNPVDHSHDVKWKDVIGKPAEFTPEYHTHDEYSKRYHKHTLEDIIGLDGFYRNNNDVEHDHDDRYYTKNQTDDLLKGKSDIGHSHDASELTGLEDFLECYKQYNVDKSTLNVDLDGFFVCNLKHDLNSKVLDVSVFNEDLDELLVDISKLNENEIEILTCEKENLVVFIKKLNLITGGTKKCK